jgi:uncharacterized protein YndB with AHSA1/START domain
MAESYIEKSIYIDAAPAKVWHALTDLQCLRKWASAFSEGTYAETDWEAGGEVTWRDNKENIGARGIVIINEPAQQLKVAYYDEVDLVDPSLPGEYSETYLLTPDKGGTLFSIRAGKLNDKTIKEHEPLWQKAIVNLREVAENL